MYSRYMRSIICNVHYFASHSSISFFSYNLYANFNIHARYSFACYTFILLPYIFYLLVLFILLLFFSVGLMAAGSGGAGGAVAAAVTTARSILPILGGGGGGGSGSGVPGPPANLQAVITSTRFVTLSWEPPSSPTPITGYSVFYQQEGSVRYQ